MSSQLFKASSTHEVSVAPLLWVSVKWQPALQTKGFIEGSMSLHLAKLFFSSSSRGFSLVTLMLANRVHHPFCFQMGIIGPDV